MTEQTKYPANALEHFRDGALLDLRVRMAFELLTHSPIYSAVLVSEGTAEPASLQIVATHALNLATELLTLAESRGLIDPLPTDGELDPLLRSQAKRTASYQTLQQMEAQKFAQAEQDRVIPQAPSRLVPGGRMN